MGITSYDWGLIWDYRSELLHGLLTALEVSVVALLVSVVAGLGLAMVRLGKKPFSWIAAIYINVFRGMPALVTVIWIYFGVSLVVGINFTVFQAGVIALSLLYSAFMAEIFRSALQAVPHGHREAGQALGMRDTRIFVSVVAPQAFKIALPNVGSMFIGMIKDTSTFTVIGLLEVVRVVQNVNAQTFQPFVLYTAAAAIYVLVAFAVDLLFRVGEGAFSTPPKGAVSQLLRGRKQRRIEALVAELA